MLYSNGTVKCLGDKVTTDTEVVAGMLSNCPVAAWKHVLAMTETRFAIASRGTCERFGKWEVRNGIYYSKPNVLAKYTPPKSRSIFLPNKNNKYQKRQASYEAKRQASYPRKRSGYAAQSIAARASGKSIDQLKAFGGFKHGNWEGYHMLAVYGTLKDGFRNHELIKDSEFIGNGILDEPAALVGHSFPYLTFDHVDEWEVEVEVYMVNKFADRENIDILEGQPNHYRRIKKMIRLDSGETVKCWIYDGTQAVSRRAASFQYSYGSFNGKAPKTNQEDSNRWGHDNDVTEFDAETDRLDMEWHLSMEEMNNGEQYPREFELWDIEAERMAGGVR